MKNRINVRPIILLSIMMIVMVIAVLLLRIFVGIADSITISISVLALLISIISAFKGELFDFELRILADEVIISSASGGSNKSLALLFPISFINNGYGEGIIENIGIKVTKQENRKIKVYLPNFEINLEKFIQGKRQVHADNMLGAFSSFPLHSKEVIKKAIVFLQQEDNEKYPFSEWQSGKYSFEFYIKTNLHKQAEPFQILEREITEEMIKDFFNGRSAILMNKFMPEL